MATGPARSRSIRTVPKEVCRSAAICDLKSSYCILLLSAPDEAERLKKGEVDLKLKKYHAILKKCLRKAKHHELSDKDLEKLKTAQERLGFRFGR
jgi:hypothetical protein